MLVAENRGCQVHSNQQSLILLSATGSDRDEEKRLAEGATRRRRAHVGVRDSTSLASGWALLAAEVGALGAVPESCSSTGDWSRASTGPTSQRAERGGAGRARR